jgi:LysR family transcriptional regulator, hydrogen peroxide-inducible genes activator
MTLTELRYVLAVAKEKHFGRAAKICCVSQPSLSIAINKLEKQLGVDLFERNRNDIRVTEIGQQIIAQAERVLAEAEVINQIAVTGKSQLTNPLRVGAVYTVAPYLFPKLIPAIKKVAPDMPLAIEEDYTTNLRSKLRQGELDVIFVALPFTEPGVLVQTIYEESFVVLMRQDHPLAEQSEISAKDLENEEILLLGEGHCFRDQILAVCPHCHQDSHLQKTVAGTSLETVRHMVASGLGLTILPSSASQVQLYQDTLCVRPFISERTPLRQIGIAWRVSFPRPKAITALTHALNACQLPGVKLMPVSNKANEPICS